jgi:RNase P/RNase MRP subunit p29
MKHLDPKYIIYHDLIGFKVKAKPKSKQLGFQEFGTVINDTENMLITQLKNNSVKKLIKKNYLFRIELPDSEEEQSFVLEVDGAKLVGRPENRLRNLKKKRR